MAGASAHTTTRRILDTCAEEMQMRQLLSTISSDNWAKRSIVKAAGGTELHLGDLAGLSAMLSCPMCKGTLRHPVFLSACTPQHHFFCGECLANFTRDKDNASQCPVCATHYSHSQIKEDKQLAGITKLLAGAPVPLPGSEAAVGSSAGGPWVGAGKRKREAGSPAAGGGSGGGGSAGAGAPAPAPAAAKALRERITFRIEMPLPDDFPNPFGAPYANKKILIVPYSQTVAKNKDYLLDVMAARAAPMLGVEGYDRSQWRVELYVGKSTQARVQLAEEGVSVCEALRRALRDTGQLEALKREKGASGVAVKHEGAANAAPQVAALGTIFIKIHRK